MEELPGHHQHGAGGGCEVSAGHTQRWHRSICNTGGWERVVLSERSVFGTRFPSDHIPQRMNHLLAHHLQQGPNIIWSGSIKRLCVRVRATKAAQLHLQFPDCVEALGQ